MISVFNYFTFIWLTYVCIVTFIHNLYSFTKGDGCVINFFRKVKLQYIFYFFQWVGKLSCKIILYGCALTTVLSILRAERLFMNPFLVILVMYAVFWLYCKQWRVVWKTENVQLNILRIEDHEKHSNCKNHNDFSLARYNKIYILSLIRKSPLCIRDEI